MEYGTGQGQSVRVWIDSCTWVLASLGHDSISGVASGKETINDQVPTYQPARQPASKPASQYPADGLMECPVEDRRCCCSSLLLSRHARSDSILDLVAGDHAQTLAIVSPLFADTYATLVTVSGSEISAGDGEMSWGLEIIPSPLVPPHSAY